MKTLILLRHAHRDKSQGGEFDNGLSTLGREQARALCAHYLASFRGDPRGKRPLLMTSPKRRCAETLQPIAKASNQPLEFSPQLREQENTEGTAALRSRVREFCRWWKRKGPELTFACSHGDWIPLCLEELIGSPIELKKGAWAELILTEDGATAGEVVLRKLYQKLPAE